MQYNVNKLSNGFSVLTTKMPYLKSVGINLVVKVGSRNENGSEFGMSHFLEHMAFKGTKNRTAKQIALEFDDIGGHFNAYTSKEYTVYHAKVLSENIDTAFSILSDVIQNSLFAEEEIEKEKNVISQEIAATQDSPDDVIFDKFSETAFGETSPLGKPILGTVESITKFQRDDFIKFTEKNHFAENMYLSIAGDIDIDMVQKLADKYFSEIKSGSKSEIIKSPYLGGIVKVDRDLEQSTLILGFASAPYMDFTNYYASHLISMILGGGISSRLFQEIREKRALAYSVGSFVSSYHDTGLFSIYASTAPDKIDELYLSLEGEIEKICESISEDEVRRVKSQIKSAFLMSVDSASYKSEEVGKNYALFEKIIKPEEVISLIENLQIDDILSLSEKIFSSKMTRASIGPK